MESATPIPQPVWEALSSAGMSSPAALLGHLTFTPSQDSNNQRDKLTTHNAASPTILPMNILYDSALSSVITDDIVNKTKKLLDQCYPEQDDSTFEVNPESVDSLTNYISYLEQRGCQYIDPVRE